MAISFPCLGKIVLAKYLQNITNHLVVQSNHQNGKERAKYLVGNLHKDDIALRWWEWLSRCCHIVVHQPGLDGLEGAHDWRGDGEPALDEVESKSRPDARKCNEDHHLTDVGDWEMKQLELD